MTVYLSILLRLIIWFLLTSDLSLVNIVIGVAIAILLPHDAPRLPVLKDWIRVLWEIIIAVPVAYFEALQIMILPHKKEAFLRRRVRPNRTPGLIFLDIFLITFTPKTIVLSYQEDGWYKIHSVERDERS